MSTNQLNEAQINEISGGCEGGGLTNPAPIPFSDPIFPDLPAPRNTCLGWD